MCRSARPGIRHSGAVYGSKQQWSVHRKCHGVRHFVWSYVLHHIGMRTLFARTPTNMHTHNFASRLTDKISVLIVQQPSIGNRRCANVDESQSFRIKETT